MSGVEQSRPDNPLLSLYRRYLGEPESETDVYVGFALFFGGLTLAALGFLVFLWNVTVPRGTGLFVQLREIAIALAILGLPAFVLSVVVLLPVRRLVLAAGVAGAALAVVGVGVFVATYPEAWNVPGRTDYSVEGISAYAAGMAILAAATGSALVGHHLQRARTAASAAATNGDAPDGTGSNGSAGSTGPSGADAETVTDEQVRRDIEEAVEGTELTWGGVQKSETKRLTIDTGAEDAGIDYSGFDPDTATESRSAGVDDAVAGLRRMQGGEPDAGTGEGTDDQTAALQALRERQEAGPEEEDSVVGRMRDRLGL